MTRKTKFFLLTAATQAAWMGLLTFGIGASIPVAVLVGAGLGLSLAWTQFKVQEICDNRYNVAPKQDAKGFSHAPPGLLEERPQDEAATPRMPWCNQCGGSWPEWDCPICEQRHREVVEARKAKEAGE